MPLSNSIEDLDPDLALCYEEAKADWKRDYPAGPWPELNETRRSEAVQNAYYARGRASVAEVQRLYKAAGLYGIGPIEATKWATNAKYGQSAHNASPDEYASAFDVKFRVLVPVPGKPGAYKAGPDITWESRYYTAFGGYMIKAASRLLAAGKISDKVVWGGDWNQNGKTSDEKRPDLPHFERKNWRLGRRKKAASH